MRIQLAAITALGLCASCSSLPDPAEPDPYVETGYYDEEGNYHEAEPEPEPEPEPKPEPPVHTYALRWQVEVYLRDTCGVAVAPWGDVVALSKNALQLYACESGKLLAESPLHGLVCLANALDFQTDGTLLIVSEEGIERVSFPARSWERLVELESPERAVIRGPHVAVLAGKRQLTVYTLPETEPVYTLSAEHDVHAFDVAPDGRTLALSYEGQGVFLHDLSSGQQRQLSESREVGLIGFGESRLFASTRRGQLVPWTLDTHEEHSYGYELVFRAGGKVYELANGLVLLGNTAYPAQPAKPKRFMDDGTTGLDLPLRYPAHVAPRPDGRAIVGLSSGHVGYASLDGADPERPFALAALVGYPPPPPGRTANDPLSASERAKHRTEVRAEFRDELEQEPHEPLEAWTHSFLAAGEVPASPTTRFVRLIGAAIGGDFDDFGSEEVVFELSANGSSRLLHRVGLALSDSKLYVYHPEDPAWIELPSTPEVRIELDVFDADFFGREHMTSLPRPFALAADASTSEPTLLKLPLDPILRLEGAWAELEHVRVPRRDARDAASVAAVRSAFGPLLELQSPTTPPNARALAEALDPAIDAALLAASESTHTRVRRVLSRLAEHADALRPLAPVYGAADASLLQSELSACVAWIGSCNVLDPELVASCEALSAIQLSSPLTREHVDRLIDAALQVEADNELAPREPLGAFTRPLDTLLELAKTARPGLDPEVGPALAAGWETLIRELRVEVE